MRLPFQSLFQHVCFQGVSYPFLLYMPAHRFTSLLICSGENTLENLSVKRFDGSFVERLLMF